MKMTLLLAISCVFYLTAYTAAQAESNAYASEPLYVIKNSSPTVSEEKLLKRQSAKHAAILNAAYAARLELTGIAAEDMDMND